MAASPFIPTIIIVQELHAEIRGYPLLGYEFELKEPRPRHDKAITLDGEEIVDDFWVVCKREYYRVVPIAQYENTTGDEVLIPTFIARLSFRPCYVKRPKIHGY